jgi:hypothetical protein
MALDVPSWVNFIGWVVALIVGLVLYRNARVRLRDIGAKVAELSRDVATLSAAHGGNALPMPLDSGEEAAPQRSGRRMTLPPASPAPPSPVPVTRPSTAPGDARAARTTSSRPPPPVEVVAVVVAHGDAAPAPPTPSPAEKNAIEARYESLCERARADGLAVGHCDSGESGCELGDAERSTPRGVDSEAWRAIGAADVCRCNCEGCRRSVACYLQAQRDVMGPRFHG